MTPRQLLAIYFASRYDWPISAPLGRDPAVERNAGNDASRLLRVVVDVGTCFESMKRDYQQAIYWRWVLLASAEEHDVDARKVRYRAVEMVRSSDNGNAKRLFGIAEKIEAEAANMRKERRKFEKRKAYRDAMAAFVVEVKARNLYNEALSKTKKFDVGS